MRITWIGHSCFFIEAHEAQIVTDPFGEDVPYTFHEAPVDIVTVSHGHFDHNAVHRIPGDHAIIKTTGDFDVHGVPLRGIPSFHDDKDGAERGPNILYLLVLEGMTIAHLGDLGEVLSNEQRTALSGVEILFIPVGGNYTIDAKQAASVIASLSSVRLVIPMHYKTNVIADWPIAPVEEFESLMDNVRRVGASIIEVTRESLPEQREVWILDHAQRL